MRPGPKCGRWPLAARASSPWVRPKSVQAYIGPATEIIDLTGLTAVPGFIDGHAHFMGLGQSRMVLDLTDAQTWDDIVTMVRRAAAAAEPGEWIRGRGWHQEKWSSPPQPNVEGFPLHAALSQASQNNPVFLEHASGHAGFVNAQGARGGEDHGRHQEPAGRRDPEGSRRPPQRPSA